MSTTSFDAVAATRQLGEALLLYRNAYARVDVNPEYTRMIVAGIVWEGEKLPPFGFLSSLIQQGLIVLRQTSWGWYGVRPTDRYLEQIAEGAWLPEDRLNP